MILCQGVGKDKMFNLCFKRSWY